MSDELIVPDWPAPAGVQACITTRAGGVSGGPFASNNLAFHVGDNQASVVENRNRLMEKLNLELAPQWLEQVHGRKVVAARADERVRTADGCFTSTTGLACAVLTADCLPVLLCNKSGSRVAAVHAGWRGLAKGIIERGLKQFEDAPEQILAYLGPAISKEHFEVGIEVLEAFFKGARSAEHAEQIGAAFSPSSRPMRFYADIYALARAELEALGVTAVFGGSYCSFAEGQRFYSYRREGETGRMASLIWLRSDL